MAQDTDRPAAPADGTVTLDTLVVERRAGIVTVTFNRPSRKNAANGRTWVELVEVFSEIQHNAADRVVIHTGAGVTSAAAPTSWPWATRAAARTHIRTTRCARSPES